MTSQLSVCRLRYRDDIGSTVSYTTYCFACQLVSALLVKQSATCPRDCNDIRPYEPHGAARDGLARHVQVPTCLSPTPPYCVFLSALRQDHSGAVPQHRRDHLLRLGGRVYNAPAPCIRALVPANMHVLIDEREAPLLCRCCCSVIASFLRHTNSCNASLLCSILRHLTQCPLPTALLPNLRVRLQEAELRCLQACCARSRQRLIHRVLLRHRGQHEPTQARRGAAGVYRRDPCTSADRCRRSKTIALPYCVFPHFGISPQPTSPRSKQF